MCGSVLPGALAGLGLLLVSCFGTYGSLLGDLQVGWNFQNAATCSEAGVAFVEVLVQNAGDGTAVFDQIFDCTDGDTVIGGLVPGKYKVTLNGLDLSQNIRYQSLQTMGVSPGYNSLGTVIMGYSLANISFTWSFGGQGCRDAGVSQVQVVLIDSEGDIVLNLTRSCTDQGASIDDLVRGNYVLSLFGIDVTGTRMYSYDAKVAVKSGENNLGNYDLAPVTSTGSLSFTWTFNGGNGCQQSGVSTVRTVLASPSGQIVFASSAGCSAGGLTITGRQPGFYDLTLTGFDFSTPSTPVYSVGPLRVEIKYGQNDLGVVDLVKI
jgi:hypothetical protein